MEGQEKKPLLEFQKEATYKIELLFESPKSGKNQKGNDWYLFGVKHNGIEKNFFADYDLKDELLKFTRGDIVEITDEDLTENPWAHKWKVVTVSTNNSLDEIIKSSKNNTEIKIQVFASMKIASAISANLDELKSNTHSVMALHKEICQAVKNEEEIAKNEADLF
jgi:hypothetical protein